MFKRFTLMLMASILVSGTPQPERWSLLSSGTKKGTLVMTPTGKSALKLHATSSLRGWVDDLEGVLVRDGNGLPTRFSVQGTQWSVAGYREMFRSERGRAKWSMKGESRKDVPVGGFYLPNATSLLNMSLFWMAETSLVRQGSPLPIISGGQATFSEPRFLDLTFDGKPIRVKQQVVAGLDLVPVYLWSEADGRPLAAMNTYDFMIRDGKEALTAQLEEAAAKDLRERMHALGVSARLDLGSTYALTHVDVFDPHTNSRKPDQTVVVEKGRILAVGPFASIQVPEGARSWPLPGKTLLPGLWDTHFHINTQTDGLIALASGSVCVFSPGDDPRKGPALRKAWDQGLEAGPWATSALLLDGPGPNTAQKAVVVDSREEVLTALVKAHAEGYFGIKIYGSLRKDLVPFIIQESRKQGFWVSGHVPAGYTIQDLVALGFREANHVNFAMLGLWPDVKEKTNGMARFSTIAERAHVLDLKGPAVQELLACFRQHGTVVDPTLVVFKALLDHAPGTPDANYGSLYERLPALVQRNVRMTEDLAENPQDRKRNRASFQKVLGFIRELYGAGVPIVPGTDNESTFSIAREMAMYVEAGIPAPEVLHLATLGTAKVFGQDMETGSIEAGKRADFVLVEGDPTQDIRNLERMVWVSKGGTVYDREKLLEGFGLSSRTAP